MLNQVAFVHGRASSCNEAGSSIDWHDIEIGKSLTLYKREFFVTGCDDATKDFLRQNGAEVAPNATPPQGPYEDAQKVGYNTSNSAYSAGEHWFCADDTHQMKLHPVAGSPNKKLK